MASPSPVLRIEPAGWTVPVADGQSLLEAAQAAGIRLPRSCRNGSCRACRCRLLQGHVRYRVEWPGLLAEEKAEGWILPCVALADEPLVVIDAEAATKA
ncbi:2Fe-2S iron-sulfur cluster-binding protein [Ideonella sp. YS5]|uniref:2Fe-2S iron-sulfur cluster-binding protein n=1 Tax=Ideonella sp. YS5 TaxID=3453714 RepID=UPI003EEED14A